MRHPLAPLMLTLALVSSPVVADAPTVEAIEQADITMDDDTRKAIGAAYNDALDRAVAKLACAQITKEMTGNVVAAAVSVNPDRAITMAQETFNLCPTRALEVARATVLASPEQDRESVAQAIVAAAPVDLQDAVSAALTALLVQLGADESASLLPTTGINGSASVR